jgi:putative ABC transport system permease protein
MIGITIGVFSVISVMTAIGRYRPRSRRDQLSGLEYLPVCKIPVSGGAGGRNQNRYENRRNITYQQALRYAELMEGYASEVCLKTFDGRGQAVYNGLKTTPSLTIAGSNQSFLAANSYTLAYGRNITAEDVDLSRAVVLIGQEVQKRLFPHESPIGKVIKLGGHNVTVIGVLGEKGSAFGQSQDDICVLPLTRFFENFGSAKRSINIATQSASQETYNRTLDRAIGAMRIARGLKPHEENDFEIYSNDSLKSAFASIADVVRIGAFVISLIALIAAGVGIMNIMLVSVTERTKEIGIRKSIGARSRDILRQFLTEAVFISEAGGILGIILGVAGGNLLAAWLNADVIFPFGWAAAGLVVCSAIGIGFGFYPAYRAASLDPIEALRFE